ncbi:Asp23/Gls24 family envelope stress response protein [Terrabacter aeriphilus]|uniref:Asp23/Gls24 family envelope stress response protein n=1 Tax=Terrabacter aeriphilus TaxID=515662 RepID=UPI0031EED0A7
MNDAEPTEPTEPTEPNELVDAGARGTLVLRDRAVERIVEAAVLEVDGVLRHADTLEKVTGRSLPRVEVVVAGNRARASVEIATRWPSSLADVATRTKDGVARALTELAGLTVDAVDVHVAHLPTDIPERRRVQ